MKALMSTTEKFLTTTEIEAESIVTEKKEEHGSLIVQHTITKKQKKEQEFFLVSITVEYYKVPDLITSS
jgi:hypothetical protein